MTENNHRAELLRYCKTLNSSGLSIGKSGNISLRCDQGFIISPSGVSYQQLSTQDLVKLDTEGAILCGSTYPPSSEWHFHANIYKNNPTVNAVVHAHPTYCTSLAATGRNIPAFHYMVAIAGGHQIPLAPYELFGSTELSRRVDQALENYSACLLENHGMIATGRSLNNAFQLALEVEELAKQYVLALSIGEVKILDKQQMDEVLEQFKRYGQRH